MGLHGRPRRQALSSVCRVLRVYRGSQQPSPSQVQGNQLSPFSPPTCLYVAPQLACQTASCLPFYSLACNLASPLYCTSPTIRSRHTRPPRRRQLSPSTPTAHGSINRTSTQNSSDTLLNTHGFVISPSVNFHGSSSQLIIISHGLSSPPSVNFHRLSSPLSVNSLRLSCPLRAHSARDYII